MTAEQLDAGRRAYEDFRLEWPKEPHPTWGGLSQGMQETWAEMAALKALGKTEPTKPRVWLVRQGCHPGTQELFQGCWCTSRELYITPELVERLAVKARGWAQSKDWTSGDYMGWVQKGIRAVLEEFLKP